jgi:hypothetical protein
VLFWDESIKYLCCHMVCITLILLFGMGTITLASRVPLFMVNREPKTGI